MCAPLGVKICSAHTQHARRNMTLTLNAATCWGLSHVLLMLMGTAEPVELTHASLTSATPWSALPVSLSSIWLLAAGFLPTSRSSQVTEERAGSPALPRGARSHSCSSTHQAVSLGTVAAATWVVAAGARAIMPLRLAVHACCQQGCEICRNELWSMMGILG